MKILLLHASAGAGHKRAAEALEKAFRLEDPAAHVVVRDVLDFTPPAFRRTYARGYLDLVRRAPEVWGYFYARADRKAGEPWRRKVRSLFNRVNATRCLHEVRSLRPDAVVCTHFLPLELLATARREGRCDRPLYGVVTDFAVHALWILSGVNAYYVATEEARRSLLRRRIPADDVLATGIPIDPVFAARQPAAAARRRLGLAADPTTLLLLGGGFGVGPTVELIRSFRESARPLQILVVAGANEAMRRDAQEAARECGHRVQVYGFVTNIHELMDAADLVITKPGGLTSSEVLAKGKPMILVDPIPGQEQRNCEYLMEGGAAVRLYDVSDAPWKVEQILAAPERMKAIRTRAAALGAPDAARDIARDILKRENRSGG